MGKEDYNNMAGTATAVNGQPLMATATPVTVQATTVETKTIQVTAPADLAEGYQFEAEANGQRFGVIVVSRNVVKSKAIGTR